jgi:MFS family permease
MKLTSRDSDRRNGPTQGAALRFVVLIGVMSLFADFTYEGARSIVGPYLAILGASATAVGIIAGLGELLGYGLRVVSGRLSERTQKFWPITLVGYFVQMSAVPALALAGNWQTVAVLIVLERVGKAIRNPPRDVMLSHAAREMGYGWGFGLHEALDQLGALIGPLVVAAVLVLRQNFAAAFAVLALPALATLSLLLVARFIYPRPEELERSRPDDSTQALGRRFWIYLAGAALVAAGFADFSLMAFHFQKADIGTSASIPLFYAAAMATSGLGSLVCGRLFDRAGIVILVPLTIVTALFAPLVFLGGFWPALVGVVLWGLGMGVHESIVPAAVAGMVPAHRRATAYGVFTAGYGIAWFLGSAALGALYDVSLYAVVAFAVAAELAAVPFILMTRKVVRLHTGG